MLPPAFFRWNSSLGHILSDGDDYWYPKRNPRSTSLVWMSGVNEGKLLTGQDFNFITGIHSRCMKFSYVILSYLLNSLRQFCRRTFSGTKKNKKKNYLPSRSFLYRNYCFLEIYLWFGDGLFSALFLCVFGDGYFLVHNCFLVMVTFSYIMYAFLSFVCSGVILVVLDEQ